MLCNASNHSIFRSLLTRVSQWSGVGGDKRTKLSEKMVSFFLYFIFIFPERSKRKKNQSLFKDVFIESSAADALIYFYLNRH